MSCLRLAFQEPESFAHRVCDRPIEVQDLSPGAPSENDAVHLPSTASGGDISTKLGQRYRLAILDLSQPLLNRPQGLVVREDLCRLFKSVVFVYRNQDCCRTTVPSHDDVLTQVGNAIDEVSEFIA
jgi:hypothetical protein